MVFLFRNKREIQMKNLANYELKSEFDNNKNILNSYPDYTAFVNEEDNVYLKELESYFLVTTNGGGNDVKINVIIDNIDQQEISLTDGVNKVIAPYGFYFNYNKGQKNITSFDFKHYDTSNVTFMSGMFRECSGLTSLDLSSFDTSNVTNMYMMFYNCRSLSSLDTSKFDTSNVIDMSFMFYGCQNLTELNLSSFDTSKVTDMHRMFIACSSLTTLDVSSFDTSKVTDMCEMFNECANLESLDLSNFDTSNVTTMLGMFQWDAKLTSLDLSNFDTSNVTNASGMFKNCDNLNYIRCKQSFKDWCIVKQDDIDLPTQMREGGGGTWEIIG